MPALAELEAEYERAKHGPRVRRRSSTRCCASTLAARRRCTLAARLSEQVGAKVYLKREDLEPHRRAQDQRRPRAGAARAAHGQAPHHRGDRRRPARRRDRDRRARSSASTASSTWAPRTSSGRRSTSSDEDPRRRGAPGRLRARARSRTRPTRRSATGSRTSATPTTSSAPWSGRTRTRSWCATSSRVIGREAQEQMLEKQGPRCPTIAVACVGGGSNAIGLFHEFLDDPVRLVGVEAAGEGLDGEHAATLSAGRPGVLHGTKLVPAAGRVGPGARGALDLSRPRLPGRRSGARLAQGHASAPSTRGHGRRGARRLADALPQPKASSPRSSPRTPSRSAQDEAAPELAPDDIVAREPHRPRRQGHGTVAEALGVTL